MSLSVGPDRGITRGRDGGRDIRKRENGVGTAAVCWLFFPKYQDKAVHSCLPSLSHAGSVWQLRVWVVQRARSLMEEEKALVFLQPWCYLLVQRGQSVEAENSENQPSRAREAFPDLAAALAEQDVGFY